MPVVPQIQSILDAVAGAPPQPEGLSLEERRAIAHKGLESTILAFGEPAPEDVTRRDVQITVKIPDHGKIPARVYTPAGPAPRGGRPAHVYFHGGAWWLGTLDQFDAECANLAKLSECVVISVDYRLAPEFAYPVPFEDGVAAWDWVQERAFGLGVNPDKVSIGGSSAGGNIAAAVTLALRDRRIPMPVCQVLEIPALDLTLSQPSVKENGTGYLLTEKAMRDGVTHYIGEHGDATDPYASPLHAETLLGLPPALVVTCEFDPLRDEGEAYAKRLAEAGVATEVRRWDGLTHGAGSYTALLEEARAYRQAIVDYLRAAHKL
ncbi:MAG: alpha/beta hydrolase [Streptomycetaceae bacterium]|nr:alpha/beta hydrolase [Streptomycetaceae bacterium]